MATDARSTATRSALSSMLAEAAAAAGDEYVRVMSTMPLDERRSTVGLGADGTETYLFDVVVERVVLDVLERHSVNVLSEEVGWIDRGSAVTVVLDPVDGTANAVAGVPISAFAAAAVVDDVIECSHLRWLATGRDWTAARGDTPTNTSTGRRELDGASISMLRPRPSTVAAWNELARRADRVRVLGSSVFEAALVADGAIDMFCDPGGDVHRIVDIAAAALVVEQAGGTVIDALGRPFTFEPDLSLRWSGVFASSAELAETAAAVIADGAPTNHLAQL